MRLLDIIGRMLLGGSIRRALWRSPKALLIAAALVGLALMSIGNARAQNPPAGTSSATKPEAYAKCMAYVTWGAQGNPNIFRDPHCQDEPQRKRFVGCYNVNGNGVNCSGYGAHSYAQDCPADAPWNPETGTCGVPNTCPDQPNLGASAWSGYDPSNASICKDSCSYSDIGGLSVGIVTDGVEYTYAADWEPTGAQCSVASGAVAPPSDADGDGTSDGFDGSPNNPGSGGGGGPDGLGQPEDKDCGGPGQPACGENGSGSGNGNSSGGGGNCKTPPSSSGDAILAQIAYQAWATRCAVEGLGKGEGEGDSDQPDWTKGDGPAVEQDGTDYVAESSRFGIGLNPNILDRENIFGGGSCPAFSITVLSATVSTNDFPAWCSLIAPAMRGLILLMGAFTALGILLGRFGV